MFGGFNCFVIEGKAGVEMYEKITKAFDLCVEFDTHYEIDRVNGKTYTVQKSKNEHCEGDVLYFFSIWDNVEPGSDEPDFECSMILPRDVELKDGNLHIVEGWMARGGVLRYYIADVKLHKTANVYYYAGGARGCYDGVNYTNDVEGKYFKSGCEFTGSESEIEEWNRMVPANFYELSVDEQVSICDSLIDNGAEIYFEITRIGDPEKFFWTKEIFSPIMDKQIQ